MPTGHGTRDPRGQETIAALVEKISRRCDHPVHPASVDVQHPRVGDVVAALPPGAHAIIVPLLLSAGYHTSVDLVEAAARLGHDRPALIADPLGPDPDLARLQARRLRERGWRPGKHVIMGVVGSSLAEGQDAAERQAEYLAGELGTTVTIGYGAAARPRIDEAVASLRDEGAREVYVSSYILAPGVFHDRLEGTEAATTEPLMSLKDPSSLDLVAHLALRRARQRWDAATSAPET
ncbi:sirohydrochlorin chelatase [Curtobacterium sp. S6]|uniref:sirohydrochlorin chelatase n=1 Tax=Curtobacterium sp. S6 TaxID=1479623 RepID=UPI000689F5C4|nr:CbiX/SirB N-terminal domain-containing protein [Curtobacterium sp. S6]